MLARPSACSSRHVRELMFVAGIELVKGKLEDVQLSVEKVDIIISEVSFPFTR